MKKIIFISNEGSQTGAPIFLVKLIRQLKKTASYHIVVLFLGSGNLSEELKHEEFEVFIFEKNVQSVSNFPKMLRKTILYFGCIIHYIRYIKFLLVQKPDLIYSNTIVNAGEVILAGFLRIPIILHMHEGRNVANQFSLKLKLSCFFVDKIIVGSHYVNRVLFEITGKYGKVIYNGVKSAECITNKYRMSDKPVLLGMIGTIIHNKGQHVALEATEILLLEGANVRLSIAGISGDQAYLKKLMNYVNQKSLGDFVKFVGTVPSADEFISELDVLLVPSFDEAFPTVILEAFSVGTPVIASNVGGIVELIDNEINGFLFNPGDSIMLASVLNRIIGNHNLLAEISYCASNRAKKVYDINNSNLEIADCIEQVLSKRHQF